MAEKEARSIPPYVPWRTFENYLDGLKAFGPHLPNVIDRDSMRTLSGAMQSWLLTALRSLNMIDDDGIPRPRLQQIVHATPDERKPLLKQVIDAEYPFLRDINLRGATPKQIEAAFETTGATGDTVRKCIAFFIGIAKAADIPLSSLIVKARRQTKPSNGATKTKKSTAKQSGSWNTDDMENGDDIGIDKRVAMTSVKTIKLPNSGGSITLSGNINLFDLEGDERALVFEIIDKMKAFEANQKGGYD